MGAPIQVSAGDRYGSLTVIAEAPRLKKAPGVYPPRMVNALCDCGNQTTVILASIRTGNTKSCGCLHLATARTLLIQRTKTHGMAHTPLHYVWKAMRERCSNPKNKRWKNYGGRGIKVCGRWQDFANFAADMGTRPDGLTLDRINNDGDYEPGNCRWATHVEQANNRRSPRRVQP